MRTKPPAKTQRGQNAKVRRLNPATMAALREGIADGEAGREQPFEEYITEMQAKQQARQKAKP